MTVQNGCHFYEASAATSSTVRIATPSPQEEKVTVRNGCHYYEASTATSSTELEEQELEDQKRQQFLQELTLRQKQRRQRDETRLQKQQVMLDNQQQQDVQQIYGN